ncbi:hypothetical protein HY024_02260 [Candidatus Curtissbacteria bacterium]|nr:hypothetical protein [Candidatus Curtissbacteria bacterium]
MNNFLTVAKVYRNSPRGLIYIPLRYLIIPFIEIDKNVPKKGTVIDLGS